jgi:hypothetical protein
MRLQKRYVWGSLLVLTLALAGGGSAWFSPGRSTPATTPPGLLTVQPADIDLGMLPQGGTASFSVKVVNQQSQPIQVTKTEVSCDCTSVTPIAFAIGPGEAREITVVVDRKHEPGFTGPLRLEIRGMSGLGTAYLTNATVDVR